MNSGDHSSQAAVEFSERAAVYASGRPRWSEDFMRYVAGRMGIEPDHTIVEFGSGTGNSAEYFVNSGNTVYGVEVNDQMRQEAEIKFTGKPNFKSIHGAAREPNLDSSVKADFILVAQAIHWWDHEKEQVREVWRGLLKPAGKLVVLFYNPDKKNAVAQDIHACFSERWARYNESRVPLIDAPAMQVENIYPYFDRATSIHEKGLTMCTMHLDLSAFDNLMFSYSFAPKPATEMRDVEALRPHLHNIFNRHATNGIVEIPYQAEITAGKLSLT